MNLAMSDLDSVRVALRIRPLVASERERGCQEAVQHIRGAAQVIVNRTDTFTFNYVFDAHDTQEQVYKLSVSDMLDKLFCGFNATILAYGQTGSGKTHTMGTAFDGQLNEHVGVIPRAMCDIFDRIQELSKEFDFVVTCSFMELYQEQLYDLLSPQPREQSVVDMRENRNGIVMQGLTEQVVNSAKETTDCLVRGSMGRAVAATAMNQVSSRSHCIFTVTIQATKKDEMRTVTTSKFHLVDLAGSERSKKTLATGDRFKEGVKINQGLLALGNVISALGSGQGSGFVRYRDSKLTRLLQDSLGGNSITLMIACISPADYNVQETLSTLRYADRARKIKNKPIVNQDPHAAEINHLKSIIQKLRVELLAAGGSMSGSLNVELQSVAPPAGQAIQAVNGEVLSKRYQQLQERYHNLQQQLQSTLHDVAENEMRAHIAEASQEKLKAKTLEMKEMLFTIKRDLTVDITPEQLSAKIISLDQVCELVAGLDEELERTQTEIDEHKRCCSIGSTINEGDGMTDSEGNQSGSALLEVHTLMEEQAEAYTSKQIDFKEQLRRINRELNLKEEFHQRVAGNLMKFCTLEDNVEEKFKECELKIQELEKERSELIDKLRHVKENTSAKLAEERRKRLQALEHDISEMKRKNLQQAKLLKMREKETQKIQNLQKEIQAMKESKVKLIRAMRQESENFRQWKLMREKELMQLKNKDRKLQNEMARKEALHTKQRNVLKRKCEEAMAINKRLKDALERQKVAQSQRQKMQSAKDASTASNKMDQVISWVERELEVIVSLLDAEHSLEQLMEDRSIISNRIGELQQPNPPAPGTAEAQELANLEEELEMRNAQITDLQQKVCAADLEARMRSLYDSISSLGEARIVLKQLLKAISDMRREHSMRMQEQKLALDEQCALREAAEQRCNSAAKRMRLMELAHEDAIAERENTYEEKIAVLLRELHNAPQVAAGATMTPEQEERLKIQEEQLNRMDTMREELEQYKKMVAELQQASTSEKSKKKTQEVAVKPEVTEEYEDIEISSSSADELEDSLKSDPDWHRTPLYRKRMRRTGRRTTSDSSSVKDETFATASSDVATSTEIASRSSTHSNGEMKRKRSSCKCRGKCSNNRCGCRNNNDNCTLRCGCGKACSNGKPIIYENDEGEQGAVANGVVESAENDSPPTSLKPPASNTLDATFVRPNTTHLTPKIARLSTLSFETPSAKKKFFQ